MNTQAILDNTAKIRAALFSGNTHDLDGVKAALKAIEHECHQDSHAQNAKKSEPAAGHAPSTAASHASHAKGKDR